MKRFLVFSYDQHYPLGGWGDLLGDADTEDEAMKIVANRENGDWWHVVDLEKKEIVAGGSKSYGRTV